MEEPKDECMAGKKLFSFSRMGKDLCINTLISNCLLSVLAKLCARYLLFSQDESPFRKTDIK